MVNNAVKWEIMDGGSRARDYVESPKAWKA